MDWSEDLFDGTGFALFGAVEIILAYLLLRPLEWWRPVERWSDLRAVRTDVVYTLVNRLGLVPAIIFLLLTPIATAIDGTLRFQGFIPPTLEQLIPTLLGWSFLTFLLWEQLAGIAIHGVQYLMVGLALAMFYLLLLALSEHVPFDAAYGISAGSLVARLAGHPVSF